MRSQPGGVPQRKIVGIAPVDRRYGAARVSHIGTNSTNGAAVAGTEASAGAPTVYVCVTCRPLGEPNSPARPGAILAAATAQVAAGTEVQVHPMKCLGNCSRGPSAAMRGNGSWTYVFGGLDATCAEALIEGARMLANAADGILPWRERPAPLKRGLIARIPPIGFQETGE
jgi:predicted metal-binding protein